MQEKHIALTTQDGTMDTFITHPDGSGPFSAVILYPGLFMSVRGEAVRCASDRAARSNERRRHTRRYVETRSASTA